MNRVESLIRGLIQNIFFHKDVKLTKTAVHKILYKLWADLPEGHRVRKCLPFYWYNYGPFSEVVVSVLEEMRRNGSLYEEEDRNGNELLSFPNTDTMKDSEIPHDVNALLSKIVHSVNFYRFDMFVDALYREHAPYEFMPLYKLDFLKNLDDAVFHIYYDSYNPKQMDRLENVLFECEASLIDDSLFTDFNQTFSTFTTSMERSFNLIRSDASCSKAVAQAILKPADEVWYTFTHGVRILDPAHDEYYNYKIPQWRMEFKRFYECMMTTIDTFANTSLQYHLLTPNPRQPPSSKTKKILSSIVDGYFS